MHSQLANIFLLFQNFQKHSSYSRSRYSIAISICRLRVSYFSSLSNNDIWAPEHVHVWHSPHPCASSPRGRDESNNPKILQFLYVRFSCNYLIFGLILSSYLSVSLSYHSILPLNIEIEFIEREWLKMSKWGRKRDNGTNCRTQKL